MLRVGNWSWNKTGTILSGRENPISRYWVVGEFKPISALTLNVRAHRIRSLRAPLRPQFLSVAVLEHGVTNNAVFIGVALDCSKNALAGRSVAGHSNNREIAFVSSHSGIHIAELVLEISE